MNDPTQGAGRLSVLVGPVGGKTRERLTTVFSQCPQLFQTGRFRIGQAPATFESTYFGCQLNPPHGLAAGQLAGLSKQMMAYVHCCMSCAARRPHPGQRACLAGRLPGAALRPAKLGFRAGLHA